MLQFASTSFDTSAEEIYPCLSSGATLVLRNETMLSSSAHFLATCQQWGLTILDLPTAYWHELAADLGHPNVELPTCLRLLIIGGEQALPERLSAWQQHVGQRLRLLNTYGPTEATVVATTHQVQGDSKSLRPEEAAIIGRPLSNVEIHVLDRHLQPVPPGIPGELFLAGADLARGYLGRPSLTAELFLPNPFSRMPGGRLYRTGDRVRRLPSGELQFLGRLNSQIKLRGFRIEIGEIEAVLRQHRAVYSAVVLLREDLPGDKRLVAYVVLDQAYICTIADLRAFVQKHLPVYMVPVAFIILDTLPVTPHGKVDRHSLPAPSQQTLDGARLWEAPRTPDEELLATIWTQVLHSEQVSRHDQFFEVGGHSLLATQLVARVRDLFGIELPLRTIFETPTLLGLAGTIDEARRGQQKLLAPPITPHEREAEVPLSYAQQRLWFLDQLQPGNPSYNIALALRLTGHLEIAALHHSLDAMVRRHESLRTTFVASEGRAAQVIAPTVHLMLPLLDLSALPTEEQEPTLEWLALQEAQHPFDLAVGPLIRACVLRVEEDKHVLLLTLHHTITDAWSMGIFIHELALFYTTTLQAQAITIPELPIQYADFAIWQRQWLEAVTIVGETSPFEQQLAYWQAQLAGVPPLLELMTDHPRPQIQSFRGAHLGFTLPPELASALRKLSRQEGVTVFMTLLTAFTILLSHYSGQEDIVVGTPIANRTHAELENVIGFFVNTLALRTDLSGNPTLRELLRRVREIALMAYAHQDVPFERLIEALHLERNLSHTPLFQVIFTLQHTGTTPLQLPDITVTPLSVESGLTRFDLTLEMGENEQGLDGVFEYNLDLFETPTIQRMLGHFQLILEGMASDVEQHLISLPLLTQSEFYQQLVQWNETQTAYPDGRCIHTLFEEQAQQHPDTIALVYQDQQLTYSELNRRANQVAQYLQQRNVGPEVCVGLCVERSLELVVGALGILKAGGAYLPLDPAYPPERLDLMLQETHASVLLTQQRLLQQLPSFAGHIICLDHDWPVLASEHTANPQSEVALSNLAYIIYTSGSTGVPKGTLIEHRGLTNLVCWHLQAFALTSQDRTTQLAGISFDAAGWELWPSLAVGATMCLVEDEVRIAPLNLRDWLVAQQITLSFVPTSIAEHLLAVDWPANTALRSLLTGGDLLHRSPVSELPFALINNYGPTENTVVTTSGLVTPMADEGQTPPIGRPIANVQVYVLDAHLRPVPVGVVGELYIASVGLARSYLARPALTAERFVPHPFSQQPGARLYKTGDLVRYLPDGQLDYLGRTDAQVKIRGYRIELGEIEAILAQYPSVAETRVIMREEIAGNKQLVAYIVPRPQQSFTVGDLRRHLQGKLPDYMLPAAFVLLETLPLTPNGKLDYHALPAPESNRLTLDKTYMSPRTPSEELLAGIWASVLKLEQVGIHDNFFELGGDSILSIQIVAKATTAGLPLTPRHLFQHQTVAELVSAIGTLPTVQTEQELVVGPLPLTPIQHWFFDQQLSAPHHWNQSILLETRQPLDPALLQQAVQALLVHHDALRLHAYRESSGWRLATVAPNDQIPFTYIDLATLPQTQQITVLEEATNQLQASLDLANGSTMRAVYFDLGPQQSARLLLTIHHLSIDIVSWSILLEDLQTAYQYLSHGQALLLPSRTSSFQFWARRLQEYAQTPEARSHLDFWLNQSWADVHPLPLDTPASLETNTEASARTVIVTLSPEETEALLTNVPRVYHTQINDVLLTALTQTFTYWTGAPSLLLHLERHGREDILEDVDLSRTVGWFTALAPLVLTLAHNAGPGEDLKHIKEQLRHVPQGGISFGLLRYMSQDTTITTRLAALTQPQVSFNYAGRSASALHHEGLFTPAAESVGAIHSPYDQRPHILDINSGIYEGQLYLE